MRNFDIKECKLNLSHLGYDTYRQVYYIKYDNWRRDIPDVRLARFINTEIINHPNSWFLIGTNENLEITEYMRFGD